ncbi:MAG: hypothetical protein ACFE8M_07640 [Candidatus Hermodarchaeota archaeon]
MVFESKYLDIKTFLLIPDNSFNLKQKIDSSFESDNIKEEILGKILQFIYYFSMFKNIKPFMNAVYDCIEKTFDLEIESVSDFQELLVKNAILNFIQDYINYAKLTQKRQILKLLSDSLDKLQIQPLMINLGLLLKPMYQDKEYLDNLKYLEEIEITYIKDDEFGIQIKDQIDNWFKTQKLDIDSQENLKLLLKRKYDEIISKYNIDKNSNYYQKLLTEVMEMLTMKLTMISLMDSVSEESFEPIPIK